jgi:hypothetical protein
MVLVLKPDKASVGLSTPVVIVKVMHMKATEPIGSGLRIKPRIVVTKMAKRCHAWTLSPAGTGVNQIAAPTETVSMARMRSLFITIAPFIALSITESGISKFEASLSSASASPSCGHCRFTS